MSPDAHAALAFSVAALATFVMTPVAIAIAVRTSFLDRPAGYKGHGRATPYLGGLALIVGIVAGAGVASGTFNDYGLLIGCAVGAWMLGTVDDRVNLPITLRLAAEIGIAFLLWNANHGWNVFHSDAANLLLTIIWVVGVVNAFNLMDNMDGAAATTAAVSALGAGALALLSGMNTLAPLCLAVAGACIGFLPRNLAKPSRIFMGDGGSLPLGLLVAGVAMDSVSRNYLGARGVVIGALLVGLVILDTTLVTISRTRAGRAVLSGGRDHLTHRLSRRLGSPTKVAMTLATTQVVVCLITIIVAQAGLGWVLMAGGIALTFGGLLIWQLEGAVWRTDPVPVEQSLPALGPAATAVAATRYRSALPDQARLAVDHRTETAA